MTDFPYLDHLAVRDSLGLDTVDTSSINGEGRNAIDSAVSSAHASANEASTEATSAVSSRIQAQVNGLKSYLFQYYSVGLWSYCKATDGLEVVCSDPSTSFAFDFSAVLDSTPIDVGDVLPEIDRTPISGYSRFSRSVICSYISGFVTTTLAVIFGLRKTLFSRGHRLLAIFCTVRKDQNKYSAKLLTSLAFVAADYDRHGPGYGDVRAFRYWDQEQLAVPRCSSQYWSTDVCGSMVGRVLFHRRVNNMADPAVLLLYIIARLITHFRFKT